MLAEHSVPPIKDLKWMKSCVEQAARFSTCGKRQYFAIIVDGHGHQIGSGWNGGPRGTVHCKDGGCPRFLEESEPGSNYDNCIAIHAEANALLHSDYHARRDGGTLYVNGVPCMQCAKLIANSGLYRLVVIEDIPRVPGLAEVTRFLSAVHIEVTVVDEEALEEIP